MELLFRKYLWAVNIAVLLAAAYPTAKTVNVLIESSLSPAPDMNASGVSINRPRSDPQQKAILNADLLAQLTGMPKPVPKDDPKVANANEPPPFDPNAPPVKSSLRAKLIGTMVANQPQWSLASVQDMSNNEVVIYMVGDKVLNAEILEIERLRVIVRNQNRKEFIDADGPEGGAIAAAMPAIAQVAQANPAVLGNGIKELGANKYTVPRSEIDKTLSNLNDVAMQARIVPSFKDGQANGFKVFSIRPDSIYSKIGIQNGDVISRINGYEINSPDKALEVYAKLKEASRIEVELDRNGQRVLKTYDVQ